MPTVSRMLLLAPAVTALMTLAACSSTPARQSRTFPAGDKILVGRMTYSLIDVQIQPTLPGPDPANPRTPQNRFYSVQISVSNGGNEDTPIPALALVNDAGQSFNELSDGSGQARWLGMVRRVAPGQTEEGVILFDVPTAHYKLKLTDDTEVDELYADVPLNFAHEVINGGVRADTPDAVQPELKKK